MRRAQGAARTLPGAPEHLSRARRFRPADVSYGPDAGPYARAGTERHPLT
ncbi:hypothetical protein ACFPN0_18300 [Kitasatospora cinereorecta]